MPANQPPAQSGNGPRRPDPDPTVLTTQQLDKGLQSLRELIETRLDGGDKAVELLQGTANKMPATVAAAVSRLQELHNEKFESISIQFAERDKRTEQLSLASATAIAAALQAQKESAAFTTEMVIAAMAKMEANFTKLIDQSQLARDAQTKSMDDKINLLNSRLDKGEGRTSVTDPVISEGMKQLSTAVGNLGTSRDRTEGHAKGIGDGWGYIVGAIGAAAAVATIVVALLK